MCVKAMWKKKEKMQYSSEEQIEITHFKFTVDSLNMDTLQHAN